MAAKRPSFIPVPAGDVYVDTKIVEFTWHPGLSTSQKRRSISSLHESISKNLGLVKILDISSKSSSPLGTALSAFNLEFTTKTREITMSVECAFQGSKVFTGGGPYTDIYSKSSLDAKRDLRLKESGPLVGFKFFSQDWPAQPLTAFYDWIYINALHSRRDLNEEVMNYQAFTDIEFNPKKSINCQAYSAALYVSLVNRGIFNQVARNKDSFLKFLGETTLISARNDDFTQKPLNL